MFVFLACFSLSHIYFSFITCSMGFPLVLLYLFFAAFVLHEIKCSLSSLYLFFLREYGCRGISFSFSSFAHNNALLLLPFLFLFHVKA